MKNTGNEVIIPLSVLDGRNSDDFFVLRVIGDSMYPEILDGDCAIVYRTNSVDSGKIAIVEYESGKTTIKRVNYVCGENWLELIPANTAYPIKHIDGADLGNCRILGQVVAIARTF
ncbi:MAG: S24 family peptidase [Oscillospiraceae bacterium]|jgi:repressor LexA|nr:S24 family peptidase [Oscillospiraceae bacterium]